MGPYASWQPPAAAILFNVLNPDGGIRVGIKAWGTLRVKHSPNDKQRRCALKRLSNNVHVPSRKSTGLDFFITKADTIQNSMETIREPV